MAETQTAIVYQQMKEKIENGEYSPAQSLPETALAKEFNVSRNTIKKVLLMLENDSYVTMDANKGAKVVSYSKDEVLQFLEVREVLEGFIVRRALPCLTEDDLAKMGDLLVQMKGYKEKGDLLKYSACNRAFHEIIYSACPNHSAVDITLRLKNQMKKYNSKTILVPGRIEVSLEEHTRIYQALLEKDPDRAEKNMKKHIHSVRDVFDQYYAFLF